MTTTATPARFRARGRPVGGRGARRARPRAAPGRDRAHAGRSACSRARAPARPGRSPTASPTACTAGVYVPQQVLAVTFTARAAGEMRDPAARPRRRRRAGPHLPRGRAAAAALLLAAGASAARRPSWQPHKAALVAEAAARLRLSADRAAVRDLAAEIEWAKVTLSRRETYPSRPRGPAAPDPAGSTPTAVGAAAARSTSRSSATRGVIDFEDVLLLTVGVLAGAPAGRRGGARPVPALRRRRVPGRQPAAAAPARPVARRAATSCASSATPARPSTPSPAPRPSYLLGFPRRYPTPPWSRLVRDYRSTPQVVAPGQPARSRSAAAAGAGPAASWSRSGPAGPDADLRRVRRRAGRGRRGRGAAARR